MPLFVDTRRYQALPRWERKHAVRSAACRWRMGTGYAQLGELCSKMLEHNAYKAVSLLVILTCAVNVGDATEDSWTVPGTLSGVRPLTHRRTHARRCV